MIPTMIPVMIAGCLGQMSSEKPDFHPPKPMRNARRLLICIAAILAPDVARNFSTRNQADRFVIRWVLDEVNSLGFAYPVASRFL
jgi:hypothetical protein